MSATTLAQLMGRTQLGVPSAYTERDTMLYALAIGMGHDPLDETELDFVYERRGRLKTVPTQAITVARHMLIFEVGMRVEKFLHGQQRLVLATTPNHFRPLAAELLRDCREALGGWLAGMTISATAVFLFTWAGLAALKVPLALLSALACGLLTFVPTIGPTVATLLPLAVALLVSPALALQVLILRLVLQNGEAFLLTPILLSRTVNLLPTVALMAQLSLGALLGLPGVLLALPLVVVLQVLAQKVLVEQIMDRW